MSLHIVDVLWLLGATTLAIGLAGRLRDRRRSRAVWRELVAMPQRRSGRFDPAMVADLPEPARRYLLHAIAPGTELRTTARITMRGEIGMGDRDRPGYRPMQARQILALPHGFVWMLTTEAIAGSDGMCGNASWTRFWFAAVRVVRAGGDDDHLRSSWGRLVAEATFWTPAALLPGPGIQWEAVDADTARVTVTHARLSQSVDITLTADGQPIRVAMQRWSNVNRDKQWRLQPFGGELRDFRDFAGYRLPTTVDGGNHIGTDAWFPFFRARDVVVDFDDLGFRDGPRTNKRPHHPDTSSCGATLSGSVRPTSIGNPR
jgi:hypothetical protein